MIEAAAPVYVRHGFQLLIDRTTGRFLLALHLYMHDMAAPRDIWSYVD
jgi:hypothetical protein